jgi:hypothetical protein
MLLQNTQMAENFTLYNKLLTVPQNIRTEVADYIDFLMMKYQIKEVLADKKTRKKAGFLNVFTIKPDFDEPLDFFNDYMPI